MKIISGSYYFMDVEGMLRSESLVSLNRYQAMKITLYTHLLSLIENLFYQR